MLASLLPGLRDVRTPLTVGYLWLVAAWLTWGDRLPDERPTGEGAIADLFDLSDLLGNAAVLAALSFCAYVIGALLTIPVEGRTGPFFRKVGGIGGNSRILAEFDDYMRRMVVRFGREPQDLVNDASLGVVASAEAESLRPRLLASGKTEVYGEYDRLTAEGTFRVNLVLPLIVLVSVFVVHLKLERSEVIAVLGGAFAVCLALFMQGARRVRQSWEALLQAVLTGIYQHPLEVYLAEEQVREHEEERRKEEALRHLEERERQRLERKVLEQTVRPDDHERT